MLCEYGCGQEAKCQLSNNKWCCCESHKKCPEILRKNKEGQQRVKIIKECPHCHKFFTDGIGGQYKKHLEKCVYDNKEKTIFKATGDINEDILRWQNWYNKIIEKRKLNPVLEGYKEKHHIIPKSLGGSNNKSNLIYLTAKEHYICHLLLIRITQNDKVAYKKMLCALFKLGNCNKYYNSNTYKIYREEYIKNCCIGHHNQDGEKNSAWGKIWVCNLDLNKIKMIKKEEFTLYKNQGWIKGKYIDPINIKAKKLGIKLDIHYFKRKKQLGEKVIDWYINKETRDKEKYNKNKKVYLNYYRIYKQFGWKGICEQTDYNKSRINLIQQFKRYLKDEFIP